MLDAVDRWEQRRGGVQESSVRVERLTAYRANDLGPTSGDCGLRRNPRRELSLDAPPAFYAGRVSFLCPYCGRDKDEAERTCEHPVPAHMGGNLEIDTCGECNEQCAVAVDNPILHRDGDVRALRATYDVRSPRHRAKAAKDQFVGILAGQGTKALWRPGPGGGELVAVEASEPVLEEDGTFTLVTPAEGAERHIERGLERMRREHPGKTVELEASRAVTDTVTFEHSWGIVPDMWPRFLAKVSIAVGHLAIDDFDRSREAKMLRWLLRGRLHGDLLAPGFELAAVPQKLEPGAIYRELLCPHEHLLSVAGAQGALVFTAILFGELHYKLAIASELMPAGGTRTWVLDGRGRPWEADLQTTGALLVERLALFGGAERLRRWRPPTRFAGVRRQRVRQG